jgi:hypothetical protein
MSSYINTLPLPHSLRMFSTLNISGLCPFSIRTRNQDGKVLISFNEEPILAVLFLA